MLDRRGGADAEPALLSRGRAPHRRNERSVPLAVGASLDRQAIEHAGKLRVPLKRTRRSRAGKGVERTDPPRQ